MHTQNDGQYTVLINCLREQRLASGQTQQQLAEKLGSVVPRARTIRRSSMKSSLRWHCSYLLTYD